MSAGSKQASYRTFHVKVRDGNRHRHAEIYVHRMVAATLLKSPPFINGALIGVQK